MINARARWSIVSERDDIHSDGLLALWEAAHTYDASRGEEGPFVARTLSFRFIDLYRRRRGGGNRKLREAPLLLDELELGWIPDDGDPYHEVVTDLAVEQVLRRVPSKTRDVLTAYFLEGLTLAEMGARYGITESGASRKLKDALNVARSIANEER